MGLVKMVGFCTDARQGMEDIEMILSSPLPFPYAHLVSLLVHFSAFFACLKTGVILGTEAQSPSFLRIAFELMFVLAMNSLYSGLLCFTVVLTNPFPDESIDFPAAMFHHRLWKAQRYARGINLDVEAVNQD